MRKAVDWSLGITSFFYLSVASVGYAAFGNRTCEVRMQLCVCRG